MVHRLIAQLLALALAVGMASATYVPENTVLTVAGATNTNLATSGSNWISPLGVLATVATSCAALGNEAVVPRDYSQFLMACYTPTAPGAGGRTRTFSIDDTAAAYQFGSCVISNTGTGCLSSGDLPAGDDTGKTICFKTVAAGTPAASTARCSLVMW